MLLTIFGLVDVVLGGALAASPYFSYAGAGIIGILALIALVKGFYSVLAGFASGFFLDVLGWLDMLVGALLFLSTAGMGFKWFFWVGVFMALKGIYSIATEMVGD